MLGTKSPEKWLAVRVVFVAERPHKTYGDIAGSGILIQRRKLRAKQWKPLRRYTLVAKKTHVVFLGHQGDVKTPGIRNMKDLKAVGKTGGIALVYFTVITLTALAIGLVVVNLAQPGVGMPAHSGH